MATEENPRVDTYAEAFTVKYLRSEREMNLEWLSFRASLYALLPPALKVRIDRFREDPAWRAEGEAYEMAAVYDAPKIARAIAVRGGWPLDEWTLAVKPLDDESDEAREAREQETSEAVEWFRDLSHGEQTAMVPDLEPGHSGNTFGGAVMLSYRLLAGLEC